MTPPQILCFTIIVVVICIKEKQYHLALNVLLTGVSLVLSSLVCYTRSLPEC